MLLTRPTQIQFTCKTKDTETHIKNADLSQEVDSKVTPGLTDE